MNSTDILKIRLFNQLLESSRFGEPHEVVSWMGAIQSQAFEMAKWAIGMRLSGSTNSSIEAAVNQGKIVRTHILRPTWHFVAAEDIHWMWELSAPRIRPAFIGYGKMIGADESLIIKSHKVIEKLLADGNHLTRAEIQELLIAGGIPADNNLMNQIMCRAEVEGIVCNGKLKGNKQTYALLHEWIPKTASPAKEEALEKLARKFFNSHAPATLQDFVWWSGLTTTQARQGIEAIKHDFAEEKINDKVFRLKSNTEIPEKTPESALLLPAYDEFIVSYKERSEIMDKENASKIISRMGIFTPAAALNGRIIGTWKGIAKKEKYEAGLSFFSKTDEIHAHKFDAAKNRLKGFFES